MLKIQSEFSWKVKRCCAGIKNKFIIIIILIIISIIWYWVLNSYYDKVNNKSSYVILINWKATINNNLLEKDIRKEINIWDTITTVWNKALAVLEWWDGSLTRLWWNSSVKIDNLYISNDLTKINIWFELLSWKSWSNVISFLWEESYFREYFADTVAWVRWTVFNVDLEKNYLNVTDHLVTLTKNDWTNFIINESKPFNILTFKFIWLEEFIEKFKNLDWEQLNTKSDINFIDWLEKEIHKDLDSLLENINKIWLDEAKRKEIYNKILTEYQKFNFIKSSNSDLFKLKIELKDKLINLADTKNKDVLLSSLLVDFKDTVNWTDFTNLESLLNILSNNKDSIWNIDISNYLDTNLIPEDLKNEFVKNIDKLKNIFWDTVNFINDIRLIEKKASNRIHKWLDNIKDFEEQGWDIIKTWLDNIKNLENNWGDVIKDGLDNLFIK